MGPPFLNLNEEVHADNKLSGWEEIDFDDTYWKNAEIGTMKPRMSPMLDARKLTPRPIPHLPEISRRFDHAVTCSENSSLVDWKSLLQNDKPVKLEAGTDAIVEIDSNALTTGFLEFCFEINGSESDGPINGPGIIGQTSQHVQIFAVLTDAISGELAKELMRKTIHEREAFGLAKASLAMSFYMFRTVARAGIYEAVWEELLGPWKKMLD